jgi:predicted DsbA family dithiol-disulfide isomerase
MLSNVERAVRELGLPDAVEHVRRIQDMLDAGLTGTPALVIDGEVKVMGKALDVPDIKRILESALAVGGVS